MLRGFYARLRDERDDDDALAACIERVVNQLHHVSTSDDRSWEKSSLAKPVGLSV